MPSAANYHPWGTLPQPCFQIYGTKRKASHSETSTNEQFSTAVKRHCIKLSTNQRHTATTDHSPCQPQHLTNQALSSPWQQRTPPASLSSNPSQAFQQSSSSMQVTVEATSTQHQSSMHSLHPESHGVPLTPGNPHCLKEDPEDWQSPENVRRQLELQSEQQRLGLEAAARGTKAEEDSQKLDMEFESNDYWDVPYNHQLLKMADDLEQARIAMETDMESLQQHNGSITAPSESTVHVSPGLEAVSHVRCYCKPNWEGLLEPASYI
ncbi:uncharacterized protein LOC117299700 [Asterias rubens]|uniref:uncharacterized protein LOC117299700 n=1 Tax=Asterias rubens TaxID=7604 RepID=UPI001455194D|nr:uncharacterized protein LOC117299700 [Asterias rubens]